MKFSHLADCHLGSWRQEELQKLNLESFKKAIEISIQEKVEFVLITGDLFDSAYPPIEILESAFEQLKKLKDNKIACYLIAGSHDYSASGKTFLSVLEKAGFCKNLYNPEEIKGEIFLNPIIHKNIALYGYPGKKSGLELEELRKIKLQQAPGLFRIFALHTCLEDAIGKLPIEHIKKSELPEADYYALGHLHIDYDDGKFVYAGPTFPDNFQELEELKYGSFYLIEANENIKNKKIEIKLKEVELFEIEIENAITGTDKIIAELNKRDLSNKIVLLKVFGKLKQGKTSDIKFDIIEKFAREKQAYSVLKSTSKIDAEEAKIDLEIEETGKMEEDIISKYRETNKTKFDLFIIPLISALSMEKHEDETQLTFNNRLFSELSKIINLEVR